MDGLPCQFKLRIAGQHQTVKMLFFYGCLYHLKPVHLRHLDVGQHYIRLFPPNGFQPLCPVLGRAHNDAAHIQPVQGKSKPLSDDFLILHNHYF